MQSDNNEMLWLNLMRFISNRYVNQSRPGGRVLWCVCVCVCVCVYRPLWGNLRWRNSEDDHGVPIRGVERRWLPGGPESTHHCTTWIRSLNSCSPPSSSPSWWLAVRRRRGTNRWPVRATTLWAGRPACCPVSGGRRTPGETSRRRQTAERRRATACCPR